MAKATLEELGTPTPIRGPDRRRSTGQAELRAITGPDYGRIYDRELVAAVQRIAGKGTGDTRWMVPGTLDWGTARYNPHVDITQDTTTLYGRDRDVFLFLVDDLNPDETVLDEDGRKPDSVFDFVQGITALARSKTL